MKSEIEIGEVVRARAGLERDAMAWPPGPWERPDGAWRDDLLVGIDVLGQAPADYPRDDVAQPSRAPRYGALLREFLETVVLTALIFIGIRFVVQNFRIEGQSMVPTLGSGQYLLVNKLSYWGFGTPQRGDIVVFKAWDQDKDFIKRVIAVPRDEVSIHDSRVFVNGEPLDEPYILDPSSEQYGPIVLAQDEYFVMGDNRRNSSDSRAYGPLNREHIIGKAWLTYWPPDDVGLIPDNTTSFASSQ